jgi:ribonuclease BN (tRNA processing enzyme)
LCYSPAPEEGGLSSDGRDARERPRVKIRVLGCHGSDQLVKRDGKPRQCRTCGFLINRTVMIDAGTIGAALQLEEQKRIRHILLSHHHFDHVQGLPTLADNLVDDVADVAEPVTLTSTAPVLEGLRTHLFNDRIYPNFFSLPNPQHPIYVTRTVETGMESEVAGLHVRAVNVNHLVPTVGFLIREGSSTVLYSGDTYETEEIWKVASREPTLKAAFIETSFPNKMAELARVSKHLTPALFAQEFKKLGRPDLSVYIYHVKPRFRPEIIRELKQLKVRNLTVLEEGQEVHV